LSANNSAISAIENYSEGWRNPLLKRSHHAKSKAAFSYEKTREIKLCGLFKMLRYLCSKI